MNLESFLIRLIVGVLVIWLTEFLTGPTVFGLQEPSRKIVIIVVTIVMVIFMLFGGVFLPVPALK